MFRMDEQIQELLDTSVKIVDCINQSIAAEGEKRKALLDHDIDGIERILGEQQAVTMKLENLEKRRLLIQQALGFAGMSPEQISAKLENEEIKVSLSETFLKMRVSADTLRELNKSCIDIAKMELKIMGTALPGTGAGEGNGLYTHDGRKGDGRAAGGSFNGKI